MARTAFSSHLPASWPTISCICSGIFPALRLSIAASGNPELAALIKRRQGLEQKAEEHKQLKGVMPDAEWNAHAQPALLNFPAKMLHAQHEKSSAAPK